MAGTRTNREATSGGERQRRQALLVALCILALVVAAFLAPPLTNPPPTGGSGGPGGSGGSNGNGGAGSGGGGDPGTGEVERNPRTVQGDERTPADDCVVSLSDQPRPGTTVRVTVRRDGDPVTGRPVWFNGDRVGRTNERGTVAGQVPYDRSLRVTVGLESGGSCAFVAETSGEFRSALDADGVSTRGALQFAGLGVRSLGSAGWAMGRPQAAPSGSNASGNYTVSGDVAITVTGRPIPGRTVRVRASVAGAPMRNATVAVGGERVGRTDADGTYRLTVPDRDRVTVRVRRGDFAGQRAIQIDDLEAVVRPTEGLPFPGEGAALAAVVDSDTVAGATVTIDGRKRGRTNGNGTFAFTLPADPTTTLAVAGDRQRATTTLWSVYAPTLAGVAVILVGGVASTAVAHRRGRRTLRRRLALGWAALLLTFGALVVAELPGLLAALAVLAVVAAYKRRQIIATGGRAGATTFRRLARLAWDWCRAATRLLERAVLRGRELLGRVVDWAGTLPRSVSGLAARLGAWLRALPGRARRALGRQDPRHLVAGVVALAVVAGATVKYDRDGFLASTAAVVACGLLYYWWQREDPLIEQPSEDGTGSTQSPQPTPTPGGGDDEAERRPTLRELWRRFARRVAPAAWPYRTPGEVSREAIEQGFSREEVRTLASAFRDVEYGDRPLSEARYERASEAFEALQQARREDR